MPRPDALSSPEDFFPAPAPGPVLPLQGVTVLAVEDSRYACDALRLMCQRLGARLRRAESIAAARAHLRCYRPDVVLVDLGLPDGRGEDLIRSLAAGGRTAILGMSGDPDGRGSALAAGAAGFLDKPLQGLAVFQARLAALVNRPQPVPDPQVVWAEGDRPVPDPLALHDDLVHAAALLAEGPSKAGDAAYVAGFVRGLARASGDAALEDAAIEGAEAARHGSAGAPATGRLARLLEDRLTVPVGPLVAPGPAAPGPLSAP
jgi:CheY-like chemotaxis protein